MSDSQNNQLTLIRLLNKTFGEDWPGYAHDSMQAGHDFDKFGIDGVLIQYSQDKSIMFEFIRKETYYLLEYFEDGDIAILWRKPGQEAEAHDLMKKEVPVYISKINDFINS